MKNRAQVEIDLAAIASNISKIKERSQAQVLAVVKADAYGHGLVPIAQAAIRGGATWLGVALLEEAIKLRQSGINHRILAWLNSPQTDFSAALAHDIDLSFPSIEVLSSILAAAAQRGVKPRLHLEVDTGMNRGGVNRLGWPLLCEYLVEHKDEFELVGLWSHFARADEPLLSTTSDALQEFELRSAELAAHGIKAELRHISNSAATLTFPRANLDLVRVGIAMYGLSPDAINVPADHFELTPAMTLRAQLALVKQVPAGSEIGYGGIGKCERETKLGVVMLGYSDGIARPTSDQVGITHEGKYAPIIGRVSMDQFVVDLGIDSLAKAGDLVTLFGDGSVKQVDDWALAAGTINYEIVTRLAARLPRVYLN